MKHINIVGKIREKGKKSDIKSLRKRGEVPCVLYGPGVENKLFSVDAKQLRKLTHTANSYIVDLDLEGKKYLSVMHALQFHPVTDETIHVDFLSISNDKPVTVDVPLNIFGSCEGVKQGGKLFIEARKLRVAGLPDTIPDIIDVDITNLQLGKQINAGDLDLKDVQLVSSKATCICIVQHTRVTAPVEEVTNEAETAKTEETPAE